MRAKRRRQEVALNRAAEVLEWLAKNQPHCFGWVAPYPSDTPAIALEARAARAALTPDKETQG